MLSTGNRKTSTENIIMNVPGVDMNEIEEGVEEVYWYASLQ